MASNVREIGYWYQKLIVSILQWTVQFKVRILSEASLYFIYVGWTLRREEMTELNVLVQFIEANSHTHGIQR